MSWLDELKYNPIKPLVNSGHPAIEYWTANLQGTNSADAKSRLWPLPIPARILRKQTKTGSWAYPGKRARSQTDYDLLETYRQLGFLVEMFGFDRQHPAIERAAEYVFSKQAPEGDLRGIYGNQYSPNYSAGLIELLIKAGYENDVRIEKVFAWLEGIQQDGGGWAIPLRTRGKNLEAIAEPKAIPPDKTKPFSHLVTGVVLRAYAAHPVYRRGETARRGAELLSSRFFEPDVYPDRHRVADWTGFAFPFWFTDLVSSLDSISLIAPNMRSGRIDQAKSWLIEHQEPSGLFGGHLLKDRYHDLRLWHSLAVCRVFSRLN